MAIKEFFYTPNDRIETRVQDSDDVKYIGRRGELGIYLISPGFYVEFVHYGREVRAVGEAKDELILRNKLEVILNRVLTHSKRGIPRDGEGRIIKPGDLANLAE